LNKPSPHEVLLGALRDGDVKLFVCSFICLSPGTHLKLSSLIY